MYETFYGLKEKPFSIVPDPSCLYQSERHRSALTYLEYGLLENVGFILLTGEVGTGKTTLVRYILKEFVTETCVGVVFNTNVSANQFIEMVLRAFDLEPSAHNKTESIEIFYRFLIDQFAINKKVLLIVDEAQNLSDEALEEVRMLSNLQSDNEMLLHVMLVGQPELKTKLRQPNHLSFSQRIAVAYSLTPLARNEVQDYLSFRLKTAGSKSQLFTKKAIDKIFEASNGIPRTINLLCDAAMVYGYGYDLKRIDAPVIGQVIKDKGELGLSGKGADEESGVPTETDAGKRNGFERRLINLETMVRDLHMKMEWYTEEFMRKSQSSSNETLLKLKKFLLEERKRSEQLHKKNQRLVYRIAELEDALRQDLSELEAIAAKRNVKKELQNWLNNSE